MGVDSAIGLEADRAADVDVDPAVLVGADEAAHVGVGRTLDEAARADVAPRMTLSLRPGSQHRVDLEMATVWAR